MPESEINRENVRSNFRDAQHLANHHRFGVTISSCQGRRKARYLLYTWGLRAFWMALGLPSFLDLMNIELRVIGSELGVSLLFVLEPEVWRATRQFDSRYLTSHLFCVT
jgi:hypothetical protein